MTKLRMCTNVNDLEQCIKTAVANADEDMLRRVWDELDYPIDISRV
jgi:hypothetical protein